MKALAELRVFLEATQSIATGPKIQKLMKALTKARVGDDKAKVLLDFFETHRFQDRVTDKLRQEFLYDFRMALHPKKLNRRDLEAAIKWLDSTETETPSVKNAIQVQDVVDIIKDGFKATGFNVKNVTLSKLSKSELRSWGATQGQVWEGIFTLRGVVDLITEFWIGNQDQLGITGKATVIYLGRQVTEPIQVHIADAPGTSGRVAVYDFLRSAKQAVFKLDKAVTP